MKVNHQQQRRFSQSEDMPIRLYYDMNSTNVEPPSKRGHLGAVTRRESAQSADALMGQIAHFRCKLRTPK